MGMSGTVVANADTDTLGRPAVVECGKTRSEACTWDGTETCSGNEGGSEGAGAAGCEEAHETQRECSREERHSEPHLCLTLTRTCENWCWESILLFCLLFISVHLLHAVLVEEVERLELAWEWEKERGLRCGVFVDTVVVASGTGEEDAAEGREDVAEGAGGEDEDAEEDAEVDKGREAEVVDGGAKVALAERGVARAVEEVCEAARRREIAALQTRTTAVCTKHERAVVARAPREQAEGCEGTRGGWLTGVPAHVL